MKPVSPVIEGADLPETLLVKSPDDTEGMAAIHCGDGVLLSRWVFESEEERARFLETGEIFFYMWTHFDAPMPVLLQGIAPEVGDGSRESFEQAFAEFISTYQRRLAVKAIASSNGSASAAQNIVDVAVLDRPDVNGIKARAMLEAVRAGFPPPFFIQGLSSTKEPDRIADFADQIQERPHSSLEDVVAAFKEIYGGGECCMMLRAGGETIHDSRSLLLDSRVWEKARR